MMWQGGPDPIRQLTRAVWVLVGLVAVLLVISTAQLVGTIVVANAVGRMADGVAGVACELNRAYCTR